MVASVVHLLSSTFSKDFSETTGHISFQCHMKPPGKGGKVFRPGHMIKMAAMHIYGKTLKNLLLKNHRADCLETWYVASGLTPMKF